MSADNFIEVMYYENKYHVFHKRGDVLHVEWGDKPLEKAKKFDDVYNALCYAYFLDDIIQTEYGVIQNGFKQIKITELIDVAYKKGLEERNKNK